MSIQAVSWVLEHSKSKASTRCVLIAIANNVGGDGEGWAYVDKVCAEANVHEDTYKDAVRWAIDAGELERDVREGGPRRMSGRYRPNLFRFPGMQTATQEGGESPPSQTSTAHNRESGDLPPTVGGESPPTVGGDRPPTLYPLGTEENRPSRPAPAGRKTTTRRRDELWEAVLTECGLTDTTPTASARGAWNRAVKELRDLEVTPDDVTARARLFRHRWPGATLTPTALARRWPELAAQSDTGATGSFEFDPPDPLELAQQAIAYMPAEARALYDEQHLVEGALACLQQNPDVHVSDLAIAAEFYAEQQATAAVR